MRYWGVHYDTGVHFSPDFLSRPTFDRELIRCEIEAVKRDLHANAVRIIGEEVERLQFAAQCAVDCGLTVFLSPWLIDGGETQVLSLLERSARVAEEIRARGGHVVFVVGCEVSLFTPDIIPGKDIYERAGWLIALREGGTPQPSVAEVSDKVNAILRRQVETVRSVFRGELTYAAGRWERVDWSLFEMVGLDYYRQEQSDAEYAQGLRDAASHGKPVAVLEVGCCTYEGAEQKGGLGWTVLDEWKEDGPCWVGGKPPKRSEAVQARYITDQLDIFVAEGVDSVFIFTLSVPYLTHDPNDPMRDFDMGCFSLTKLYPPDTPRGREVPPWEPKEAFRALSGYFMRFERARESSR